MNKKKAETQIKQIKEESSLKSKIEELKKIWKIEESVIRGAYFISKPENLLNSKQVLVQE
jgi:hypothetical protein